MKKTLKFVLVFVPILAVVPFLPLYIVRTRTESLTSEGGFIKLSLSYTTFYDFLSHYGYSFWYESNIFWVALNTGLALFYALLITLAVNRIFLNRKPRIQHVNRLI